MSSRDQNNLRILFVGELNSSHAQSWIDLFTGWDAEIRGFSINRVPLPQEFAHVVYSTGRRQWSARHARRGLLPLIPDLLTAWSLKTGRDGHAAVGGWLLRRVLTSFRPHLVHCFGVSYGGLYLLRAFQHHVPAKRAWKLVLQARGGPDLEDGLADPVVREALLALLAACDLFIADNEQNYDRARKAGCSPARQLNRPVPGAGGLDLSAFPCPRVPSKRQRMIYVPKAYEGYQSKFLPVLQALAEVWPALQPAQLVLTAVNEEIVRALRRLPDAMAQAVRSHDRIDHIEAMALMAQARVMAAPSLMDGVPNVFYEAMAAGAAPIVSPLPTLPATLRSNGHALFARNLHVEELKAAFVTAMTDNALVDAIAARNRALVADLADRRAIARLVRQAYARLAGMADNRP